MGHARRNGGCDRCTQRGREELPHVLGQGQRPRVPGCNGAGTAKKSYPSPRSGVAAERSYPTPLRPRPGVAAGRTGPLELCKYISHGSKSCVCVHVESEISAEGHAVGGISVRMKAD